MAVLFYLGFIILIGFVGGKFFHRFRFPSVIGYLLIGLFLGPSFLNILNESVVNNLNGFNDLALALVAFTIGSEMRVSILRKIGKGIITIILSESMLAFLLVFGGVYLFTKNISLALILGAMAPASAPAGTVAVLQEYRAKGPLTNMLYTVVGLDDGLAIVIYAFAVAGAKLSFNVEPISWLHIIKGPFTEIIGSLLLGALVGLILGFAVRRLHQKNELLAVSLGAIFLCSGVANYFHFSLILANLTLGMVLGNNFIFANRRILRELATLTYPVYIIFFVIAGAHLDIKYLSMMGIIGLIYIICRTIGLTSGAFLGASFAKSPSVIKKYLGLGILSQAGVAIGLAVLVSRDFASLGPQAKELSILVINTIAATTIIFEVLGPLATKIAIKRAGEIGKKKTNF